MNRKSYFYFTIWAIIGHLCMAIGAIAGDNRVLVPDFISSPLPGHYAGISSPLESLTEARKSAISDVACQILHEIGGQYDHRFINRVFGNPHDPQRFVNDQLRIKSAGLIRGLEQNIVKQKWTRDVSGQYICFVLIQYTENKIREMRRLSKKSKVIATVLQPHDRKMPFKLTEINRVSVVMTSATIQFHKNNRFAKTISFFIWPVPEGSKNKKSVSFVPVQICGNSTTIQITMDLNKKGLTDYFLGAKVKHSIVFKGIDEIGRPVQTSLVF